MAFLTGICLGVKNKWRLFQRPLLGTPRLGLADLEKKRAEYISDACHQTTKCTAMLKTYCQEALPAAALQASACLFYCFLFFPLS